MKKLYCFNFIAYKFFIVKVLIETNVNISNELNSSDVYRSVNYIGPQCSLHFDKHQEKGNSVLNAATLKPFISFTSDLEPLESILCPHDDPQTNTCYDMTSENRTCIVITFSLCDDSGTNSPWHQHRHWWTER